MESNRKFKVGDKVRIVFNGYDTGYFGKITTIKSINESGTYKTDHGNWVCDSSLELVERASKQNTEQTNIKTQDMKTKKAFHTFQLNKRKVTIGVLGTGVDVLVGYSICHPDDKFNKELSKKIAIGRANSKNHLEHYSMDRQLSTDYGVLKSIAYKWQGILKKDPSIIKGLVI